jgi:hypothetical protein
MSFLLQYLAARGALVTNPVITRRTKSGNFSAGTLGAEINIPLPVGRIIELRNLAALVFCDPVTAGNRYSFLRVGTGSGTIPADSEQEMLASSSSDGISATTNIMGLSCQWSGSHLIVVNKANAVSAVWGMQVAAVDQQTAVLSASWVDWGAINDLPIVQT